MEFEGWNEADVRGEILDPLVRKLGYIKGTENDVIRELTIRYSRNFLGRKNPSRDPILGGRPDYICEVRGFGRWVLEAKPPSEEITADTIEQTLTYANHPEVQASFYVVCNGKELAVFEPNKGALHEPILELDHQEIETNFHVLESLLGPNGIQNRCRPLQVDLGVPLVRGLGSDVKVSRGSIVYREVMSPEPSAKLQLEGTIVSITDGRCYRNTEGQIVAEVTAMFPNEEMHQLNQQYGLDFLQLHTSSEFISDDPSNPTIFESFERMKDWKGDKVFDLQTKTFQSISFDMDSTTYTEAIGYWDGTKFFGDFFGRLTWALDGGEPFQVVDMTGGFEVFLG